MSEISRLKTLKNKALKAYKKSLEAHNLSDEIYCRSWWIYIENLNNYLKAKKEVEAK